MRTLSHSNVKYTPRVSLILHSAEKIKHEILDFATVLSSFLSFPSHITQKLCDVYEQSARQITALLSEMFLLLVRPEWELRLASYGSRHAVQSLSYTPFCALIHGQL